MQRFLVANLLMLVLASSGCEPPRTSTSSITPAPEATPAPIVPPAVLPEQPPQMVLEKAQAGVGKRGGDVPTNPTAGDIITTPTSVYFRAQEQIVFNVQIPSAMQLYKATEGHAPQSEAEFFEHIVKANNIPLPELPAGHRYVYDVAGEQLMVEHSQ